MTTKLFLNILILMSLFSFTNQKKCKKSILINQSVKSSRIEEFDIDTLLIGDVNNDKKIDFRQELS